jgi:hypothetical protein
VVVVGGSRPSSAAAELQQQLHTLLVSLVLRVPLVLLLVLEVMLDHQEGLRGEQQPCHHLVLLVVVVVVVVLLLLLVVVVMGA